MMSKLFPAIAGLGLVLMAPAFASVPEHRQPTALGRPVPPPMLRSVTVSLPQDFDQDYPKGEYVDAVNANCRACHSTSMVLMQPPLSAEEWHKEVRKMIDVYKAPIPEDQVEAITRYLASLSKGGA
ncbi:MAG: cytochrome c [Sphingomonadales bacterium]|nr:cytochrome c [Sphingomonadales bacterium]MDE2170451.1 cytochrome c [Sphingomonadales bacterium]